MSPYGAWHGKKANLAGVHIFGCTVNGFIPKIPRDNQFSLSAQSLVFLEMSDNHKGWTLYNPAHTSWCARPNSMITPFALPFYS